GLISWKRLSQKRNTCWGTASSAATSLMVRNASGALSTRYFVSAGAVLMRCLRIAEGLNTITRRGEIGTSVPVLGLRPILCPLLRTTNDPKEDNLTVSPRSRQSVVSLSTISTRLDDSERDNPTFW